MNERRAYLQAFRAYDNCEAKKIFPYNLAIAIFIARNRILPTARFKRTACDMGLYAASVVIAPAIPGRLGPMAPL